MGEYFSLSNDSPDMKRPWQNLYPTGKQTFWELGPSAGGHEELRSAKLHDLAYTTGGRHYGGELDPKRSMFVGDERPVRAANLDVLACGLHQVKY
jgi:hypothetical protein